MLTHSLVFKRLLYSKLSVKRINSLFAIFLILTFVACIDEPFVTSESGTLSIRINPESSSTTRLSPGDDYPYSDHPDNIVRSLRILTFDQTTGALVSNKPYDIVNSALDVIKHPISEGTYNMVFLANEPEGYETISQTITFSSLKESLAYPAEAFESAKVIPMMQVIENVEISSDGKAKLIAGTLTDINGKSRISNQSQGLYNPGDNTNLLTLRLDRLGVRLNVFLQSTYNLTDDFDGLILANMPNVVPLFKEKYSGNITHSELSTLPLTEDKFTDADVMPSGMNWAKQLSRVILPTNFADLEKDGIILTVKFKGDKYSPSCRLKIGDSNYNLPYNTWLDFEGTIKEPLEVNIKAENWTSVVNEWETDQIYLKVSQTEVNITDFNGARITFESNASTVRVAGIYKRDGTFADWAGQTFNQLQWGEYWNKRWNYTFDPDTQTGSGYLDAIVNNDPESTAGTYSIVLVARRRETWDKPGLSLYRSIKVNITQEGLRERLKLPTLEKPYQSNVYVGAFYRNNEVGERIIHMISPGAWWEASVPNAYKDWIILSTTPSFDPKVGTSNPGNAEDYPVVPDPYKNETSSLVMGKHRIYFRVGLASKNPDPTSPRYGYIDLRYIETDGDVSNLPAANAPNVDVILDKGTDKERTINVEIKKLRIYVRQGENDDKILDESIVVPNTSVPRAARRFSPFNVTVQDMLDDYTSDKNYIKVDTTYSITSGRDTTTFVKYPSQGGALFQWAVPDPNYRRFAFYNRSLEGNDGSIPSNIWGAPFYYDRDPFWEVPVGSLLLPYKAYGEVCPRGYRRPNNGALLTFATNNTIAEVANAEFLSSLFLDIPVGDAHIDIPAGGEIVKYTPKPIRNGVFGFYADGFFDRHPIKSKTLIDSNVDGVCLDDARAAFRGLLFYNPNTFASIFFPAAGRRDAGDGRLQHNGGTGYYLSSSLGNKWEENSPKNIWQLEFSNHPAPLSAVPNFASSVRCIVNE